MKDSTPPGRIIPRPRMRPAPPSVMEPAVSRQRIPRFALPPVDNALPESLMESISAPDPSAETTEGLAGLLYGDGRDFFSQKDYYDLVRLKIEQAKIYPEKARARMIEGHVTVRFIITPDGQVSSVHLVKYSGNRSLDRAALEAVQNAAPFARPPSTLFLGPLNMELTITFELT